MQLVWCQFTSWGDSEDSEWWGCNTRGCEHVDSELQLSLIRGTVVSSPSLSAAQHPHPSDGFDWKSRRISCFSLLSIPYWLANILCKDFHFLGLGCASAGALGVDSVRERFHRLQCGTNH